MLGWQIIVYPSREALDSERIVAWRTGMSGTDWLNDLVRDGKAIEGPGFGFPSRYFVPAATFFTALEAGAHVGRRKVVIHEDGSPPAEWPPSMDWFRKPDEFADDHELTVEAWDLG